MIFLHYSIKISQKGWHFKIKMFFFFFDIQSRYLNISTPPETTTLPSSRTCLHTWFSGFLLGILSNFYSVSSFPILITSFLVIVFEIFSGHFFISSFSRFSWTFFFIFFFKVFPEQNLVSSSLFTSSSDQQHSQT